VSYVHTKENGKYLDDIVVGDIDQPQCHKYIKKQKDLRKKKEEKSLMTLWLANVTISPTTMSPKCYPKKTDNKASHLCL